MNQRLIAALVAAPLVVVLVLVAALVPLPFATYEPGDTFDVLAEDGGSEIIQVDGAKVYRDDGQLRMTTVLVSVPGQRKSLFDVVGTWWDDDDAVYPYDAIYGEEDTAEESDIEGQVEMVSSQDTATAVALRELGYDVPTRIQVSYVDEDTPADGVLQARDVVLQAAGERVRTGDDIVEAVQATPAGDTLSLTVARGDDERQVEVTPEQVDGEQRIGVRIGLGFDLPVDVQVNIPPAIGGPSAGLMFALAIYDTLTPGSLTDGRSIAGTGTIGPDGAVGPIGGIAQKVAGARADGAGLFLVPPANCEDALAADNGAMRLARADTFEAGLEAVQDWTADPDADLPSCEDAG
ncbi:putative protein YlbL [Nocardioides aquaticus]|uniref:Endopeptidase La n=1 Tax=Nocardioides aquaticus TaxID=160826 RepID=A0ABX8EFB2_9ACTN|nr:PDZ domain-containing protein [Nocardioides aquaticus]QVT79169.1 putative protein YlbL [Nocardioides aquaticus]